MGTPLFLPGNSLQIPKAPSMNRKSPQAFPHKNTP